MDPSFFDSPEIGKTLYKWCEDLFPICRSITGEGVRKTIRYFQQLNPDFRMVSVPTGTQVFDWTVPREWYISEAYIEAKDGTRIVDFTESNLHVIGYSIPVDKLVSYNELIEHLYTIPEIPDAIPYITSYYQPRWGFCIQYNRYKQLDKASSYHVVIRSRHFEGHLDYAECLIKSTENTTKEVLISSYICHPSMANNELSGPSVLVGISLWLKSLKIRRYNYRLVLVPETIGSLTYLSQQDLHLLKNNIIAGFNLTCLGDERSYSYIPSRLCNQLSDSVVRHVIKYICPFHKIYHWRERGSDERQYCAPGIDLPVATLMRSKFDTYPEYHTSLDELGTVVTDVGLQGGFSFVKSCITLLENNYYLRAAVVGEPNLGKRNLYPTLSNNSFDISQSQLLLDVLSMADGRLTLLQICEYLELSYSTIIPAVNILVSHGLIRKLNDPIVNFTST